MLKTAFEWHRATDAERLIMYLTDIRGFTAETDIDLHRLDRANLQAAAEAAKADRAPALVMLCGNTLTVGTASADGANAGLPPASRPQAPLCKFTIHGMGLCGDRGLTLYFARFCTKFGISPQLVSLSDMALSFFAEAAQRDFILDALCAYFPIWV